MKPVSAVVALWWGAVVVGSGATFPVTAAATDLVGNSSEFWRVQPAAGPPVVSALSAANGFVGSMVTIAGVNFSSIPSDNVVRFGGVRAQVASASATQLVVTVPPGAGYAPISVTAGGLTAYSSAPFSPTFASVGVLDAASFAHDGDLSFSASLGGVTLGDVDNDGRLDLVVSTPGSGSVRVCRNLGGIGVLSSNSFAAPVNLSVGGLPNGVAMADIDGDGLLDIVTGTASPAYVSVLRNTSNPGTISFLPASLHPVGLGAHAGLVVSDLDGDGRLDVATSNAGTNTLSILRNLSVPGTIAFAPQLELPVGAVPIQLDAEDLDGDGRKDIVAVSGVGSKLTVFRNVSTPGDLTTNSFEPRFDLASLSAPYDLAIGDLDGDGRPELAAGLSQNLVSVWRNLGAPGSLGTSSFAPRVNFPVAESIGAAGWAWSTCAGDLNGDGRPELVTANWKTNFVSVLRNTATPGSLTTNSFAPWVALATSFGPFALAAGDLDGDGRPELVTANTPGNTVSLLRNIIPPVCAPPPAGLVGWWPGDGNANDLIGTSHGTTAGTNGFGAGRVGRAFECSADEQYAVIPNYPKPTAQFTYSAWVYARSTAAHAGILRNWGNAPEGQIDLALSAGRRLSVTLKQADGNVRFVEDSMQFAVGQWVLVTAVADGSRLRLYRGGVEVGSTNYNGTLATSRACLIIGADTGNDCGSALSSGTDFWDGQIDEVAIWNRGLTVVEIQQMATAGSAGLCKPAPLSIGVLGGGGVMRSPEKPRYACGESVALTATNRPYHTFLRWSDGVTSASRMVAAGTVGNLVAVFTNTVPLETLTFKQWDRSFGGVEFDSYPSVRPTPDGGFVLAGSTTSDADGNKTTPLCGTTAAWIVKLDADGNKQWEQTVGAPGDSLYVVTVETTGDGGYVLGASAAVGNTAVANNCGKSSTNFGLADFWLVRLDASGQRMWEASYGGDNVDGLGAIATLDDGGFMLVGTSSSGATGNKTSPSRGNKDCWVVRVDANGNALWDRSFGGGGNENGLAVTALADGGFLVAGNSSSGIEGNKTAPAYGQIDYWALRLDAEGNKVWDRSYGGNSDDIGGWMTPMPGGGALLVGYSDSSISGTKSAPNRGGADYWAVRIDADGNSLWDRSFGGVGEYDWAYNVRAAADGGVAIVGESDTDIGGNKTTAQIGNSDGWLVRLDPYGEKSAEISLGGTDYDYLWSVDTAGADAFILAGGSYSLVNGNKSAPAWGNEDFWVVKMVERTAPVGTPVILVNGQFHAENHLEVTNSAVVSFQSSFANGPIFYTLNGTPPGAGFMYSGPFIVNQSATVRALAYNEDYSQSAEADPVSITVLASPILTLQPEGAVARAGTDVLLLVDAAGAAPLAYQWVLNDSPIVGATNSFLLRTNVQLTSAGSYRAIVSNPYGSTTSSVAELTVLVSPGIVSQPATTNVDFGQSVTFCVSVSGSGPLLFQWRKNGVNLPGQTNSCLVIDPVGRTDGGSYTVVVQNGIDAITSDPARLLLNVLAPPTADQFTNATLLATDIQGTVRGTNRLATSETGEPSHGGGAGGRTVWYKFIPPASGGFTFDTVGSTFDTLLAIYTGTNVGSLTLVARDDDSGGFHTSLVGFTRTASEYYIAVDGFGEESGEFLLRWIADVNLPVIISPPASQSVPPGGTAIFGVTATNNILQFRYQWRFDGSDLEGQTNSQLVISNVQSAQVGSYSVKVSNFGLGSVVSAPAVLEIGPIATLYSVDRVEEILNPFGGLGAFHPASGSSSVSIGSLGRQILSTTNSTTSFRETNHCGVIGGASRWFKLTAATNATFVMDTEGSAFNTVLAVYVGNSQLSGYPSVLIGCNDDAGQGATWSRVVFNATAGLDYLIAVDGVGGASGTVVLNWWLGNPPVQGATPPQVLNPIARIGTNLTLVAALTNGIPSPHFQWYRNQTLLGNATNVTLELNNVQLINAGTYRVVVSNAIGSITNIVARLTIDVPLNLGVVTVTEEGRTHVRVSGAAAQAFVIQGSTNFANWIPVLTNPVAAQAVDFEDLTATNRLRRFYRAVPWP